MTNTVTSSNILLGNKKVVYYVTIASDGSEETDLVVFDSSAVAALFQVDKLDPLNCRITKLTYSTNSVLGVVHLEWDASTDVLAWAFPPAASGEWDFKEIGGLKNTATSPTGDITLTTTGLVNLDKISLIIEVDPKYPTVR